MTRKTFKNFRIGELNWWINVREYKSEIEDKQFTALSNFNFEWNKLVSSKGMQIKRDNNLSWWIKWLTTDWEDVYYVHSWKVYKNGKVIPQWWAFFKVSTVTSWAVYSITLDW